MIIMPSTPRLRTPERSATNSPEAARSSGVDAVITVKMKLTEKINPRFRAHQALAATFEGADEAHAVDDQ